MKTKVFLIPLVLLLVFMPTVQAIEQNIIYEAEKFYNCSGNDLTVWANVTECFDGICNTTTYNQSITCHYGCDTTYHQCSPPHFDRYLYILAFIIGAFVLLMIVGAKRR